MLVGVGVAGVVVEVSSRRSGEAGRTVVMDGVRGGGGVGGGLGGGGGGWGAHVQYVQTPKSVHKTALFLFNLVSTVKYCNVRSIRSPGEISERSTYLPAKGEERET